MIVVFIAALACSVASAQTAGDQDNKAKIAAATEAAQKWVKLMDDGKYGESWDEAASMFKSQVTKEQWKGMAEQVGGQVGKVSKRTFKSADYTTKLPGAPEGEYVVVQYDSTFSTAGAVTEIITPTKDKDGKWRVSGYFLKPAGK
jgi:hypothetical protein